MRRDVGSAFCRLACGWMLMVIAGAPPTSMAQRGAPEPVDAARWAPHVARPPGEALRQLDRLDLLIARQAWNDVADAADDLLDAPVDGWVVLGEGRYCGLREAVQRKLCLAPPAALAAYRQRIDPVAQDWLKRGVARRDERLLWRVVDQAFCSSHGDDALWALGEILLARGEHQSARRVWSQLHPMTAGEQLAYPDSPIPIAEVGARLALVSIREGDLRRAAAEIEELGREHATAAGRMGGHEVVFAEWLREELSRAHKWPPMRRSGEWPTLFGNPQRGNHSAAEVPSTAAYRQAWSTPVNRPPQPNGGQARLIAPIVVDGVAYYQDGPALQAVRLDDGEKLSPSRQEFARLVDGDPPSAAANLSVADGCMFAVLPGTRQLIGFDLTRDAARLFELHKRGQDSTFTGHAILYGDRVVVCEVGLLHGRQVNVVCYDLGSSDAVWRRSLGWAYTDDEPQRGPSLDAELSADDGVVYVSSGLGMIAAMRAADGEPLWLQTYERHSGGRQGQPRACRLGNSLVVVAPSDSASVFALDAASGAVRWEAPRPSPQTDVLAVDGQYVLLQGDRLRRLLLRSGKLASEWGRDVEHAVGMGTVAGELIYWPTALEVLLVNRQSGEPTGKSLPLPSPGGANVVVVESLDEGQGAVNMAIAAGDRHITAYRRDE